MATYSLHRLIMGKVEIGNFYCLIGDNTLNATANATLFKVSFLGNGLRYLFEIFDFEVWRLFALRNGKIIHP